MQFPTVTTCHLGGSVWSPAEIMGIVKPDGYHSNRPFRTCWYCGSIHPEDLYNALIATPTITLEQADWKYGWPHKIYVNGMPNPNAGQNVRVGTGVDGKPSYGKASSDLFAKWYNDHLRDEGFDNEAWNALAQELHKRTGIAWLRDSNGNVAWRKGVFV